MEAVSPVEIEAYLDVLEKDMLDDVKLQAPLGAFTWDSPYAPYTSRYGITLAQWRDYREKKRNGR